MRRARFLRLIAAGTGGTVACAANSQAPNPAKEPLGLVDARDFGASGDGRTLDTKAIQAAIDAVAGRGGRVHLRGGAFLCGSIRLSSNVALCIETGSALLGSPKIADYPEWPSAYPSRSSDLYTRRSLIFAEKAENVSIYGGGVIDGQGRSPVFHEPGRLKEAERPLLLRFSECRNVRVRDISLRDSAMWVQNYLACEGVHIDSITVASRANNNNDGIDIDDCTNVRITNSDIWSGDDSICLKSTSRRGCRNVVIANCTLSSGANAIKIGTDSTGGFENIAIANCAIYDTRHAGIALQCVDGGTLDRVVVSGVVMDRVGCALFLRLGNRGRGMEQPAPGRLRNITISNIAVSGASDIGSSITGQSGFPIQDVLIENMRLASVGGGTADQARRAIPEYPDAYPECNMFVPAQWAESQGPKPAQLPSYGLYARHVTGLKLRNVDFPAEEPDARPAFIADDVDHLDIFDLAASRGGDAMWFQDVRDARALSCRAPEKPRALLRVEGSRSTGIVLSDIDPEAAVVRGAGIPPDAVSMRGR